MPMDNIVTKDRPFNSSYFEEGAALLIDKPLHWTSFDVVNKIRCAIRSALGVKKYKVGHAGTLDPLASGLLIICIGKYTKKVEEIVATSKAYEAGITLGACTPSFDQETLPHTYYPHRKVTSEDVSAVIQQFSGDQEQLPPMFSAVKVKGVPLYRMARKGQEITREHRKIQIFDLDIKKESERALSASIKCSKGTYIRTLANDIGMFLGTGGYLSSLRRTRIGDYRVEDSVSIEELVLQIDQIRIAKC